eukprot:CAMPEP_0170754146 /NCGR_PEP_ID=MMETSP0437-20130122/12854_1 /TAXON_ID=0 /ORGANISM="Sexangularia sp." /LENGTH=392 /DNA_ID=CAMNT_0011093279 /DNA_START=55 /DNA_END=1233 /DNA_ORIENTATION=-
MPLFDKEKRAAQASDGTKKATSSLNTGLARTTQKILAAVGRVDDTVCVPFDWAADNFSADRRLLDELDASVRVFMKSILTYVGNQRKLADALLELYEASADSYNAVLTVQSAAIDLEKLAKNLETTAATDLLEPLKETRDVYEDMRLRIDKVEDRRVDADRYYREYLIAMQKPALDPRLALAARATWDDAKGRYDTLVSEVRRDLVALRAQRSAVLEPILATLVDLEHQVVSQTTSLLKQAVSQLPAGIDPTAAWEHTDVVTPEADSASLGGTDYLSFAPMDGPVGGQAIGAADDDPFAAGLPAPAAAAPSTGAAAQPAARASRALPAPAAAAPARPRATALYDFDATDDTEISFKKGDELLIFEQEGDWWIAQVVGRPKRGEIPANRVKLQ